MTINRFDNGVKENLKYIREEVQLALARAGRCEDSLQIMAVTKTVPPLLVNEAIHHGILLLGENRVQEYLSKEEFYDLERASVHFIGHLQSNKVKYIIDKVSMIESLSSLKLAREIDGCAKKAQKRMDVLLEINIGDEASKGGFAVSELGESLSELVILSNIHVKGLLCIPPKEQTEKFFYQMQQLFIDIRDKKLDNIDMSVLSMGMSSDYQQAIQYGATIIRLGTALFGVRQGTA